MSPITRLVAEYTPVIAAAALFGWRGLTWGFIALLCARALRGARP